MYDGETKVRQNRNRLLMAITGLYWTSLYTYPSLLTPYLNGLEATLTQAGLIVGSYGITQVILRLPLGVLSDRLKRKKIFVIAGLLASTISALGFYFTQNIWLIFLFRAMAGVAASFWVQISSLYMNYNAGNSTKAVSQLNLLNNAGMVFGIFIGGQVISRYGYPPGFGLGAALAAMGLMLSLLIPSDKQKEYSHQDPIESASPLGSGFRIKDKGLIWGSLLGALSQYLTFSTGQGFVPQFAIGLGATTSLVSIMNTLNAIGRIIAIILVSRFLLRYFRPKQILVASMVLYISLIFLLPSIPHYRWLFVILFLFGMCSGIQMTYFMDAATSHIHPVHRASAMGFYQSVYGIGMVVGPAVTGAVADALDLPLAFSTVGLVGLLTLGLMLWKLPDRPAVIVD